jgi:hypothetical protein
MEQIMREQTTTVNVGAYPVPLGGVVRPVIPTIDVGVGDMQDIVDFEDYCISGYYDHINPSR